MVERYLNFFGKEETMKILKANEKTLPRSIRVNTLKINSNHLKNRLIEKNIEVKSIDKLKDCFIISQETQNLGHLHEYLQGYYYIQSIATMIPPILLNPSSSDVVIDMCAAPGGKATHIANIMGNKGTLILIDRNKRRIPALKVNLKRLGVVNAIVINYDSVKLINLGFKADKILLDAPCTGEGLIIEDKTRKKSKSMNDILKMSKIQKKLLQAGLQALKKNGTLLYCTCSIAPEENEMVIDSVLKKLSNYSIFPFKQKFGVPGLVQIQGKLLNKDLKYSQRLFPHIHNTIGFFMCLIKRTG